MKIGDNIDVTIAGQPVAQARVKELADGTVTLEFPATRVVMATRTELAAPEPVETDVETIITGVDQNVETGDAPAVDAPSVDAPSVDAPSVEETTNSSIVEGKIEATSIESANIGTPPTEAGEPEGPVAE